VLPARLKAMKASLELKGYTKRSTEEDKLFDELKLVDETLDNAKQKDPLITGGVEKKSFEVVGPRPGACPTCGRS
jgi:hypothetical protein